MTADRTQSHLTVLIAVLLFAACMRVGSTVFAPVAFALFTIALAWPMQSAMQRRLPKILALAISILVVLGVFLGFGLMVAWAFGRVGRWLIAEAALFQAIYEQVTVWLEGHGVAVAGLWSEHFNVGFMIRTIQDITGRLNTTLSFWLVVFVYVLLGLLDVDDVKRNIQALHNPVLSRMLIEGSAETGRKIRKYMIVRTQMSVLTGVLVWLFAKVVGLPLATEWGVIAFILNYIPFIGPFVATILPTLLAMALFATWQETILVFAVLNLVQFVVGSYIEPRVSGSAVSMLPSVVLFSVFFWTYMWGLFGAFIGVPVTIAILTYCAYHPASRWLAVLLGMPEKAPAEDAGT